jgi:hypothetical protein
LSEYYNQTWPQRGFCPDPRLDCLIQADLQAYLASRAEWTAFRQKTKQIVITSPEPEQTGVRNNKVDAIGRFLTKLSKPSNYNQALIEELNKFNLKNFREDLASALAEAVLTKFDLTLMVKVREL